MLIQVLIRSTCICVCSWVGHRGPDYGVDGYVFPNNEFSCTIIGGYYTSSSMRSVGHPSDISISTISLFQDVNLISNMTQFSTNVPNYNGNFSSFIVTPPGEATFYNAPNYKGLSICLKPIKEDGIHYTRVIYQLGIQPGDIKSMKFGCDSANIIYSSPMSASKHI